MPDPSNPTEIQESQKRAFDEIIAKAEREIGDKADLEIAEARIAIAAQAKAEIEAVKRELTSQMKTYLTMFSVAFGIAGALLVFAGFLGYKEAVDRAVDTVKQTLTQDVKSKIVSETTAELDPQVRQAVTQKAEQEVKTVVNQRLASYVQKDQSFTLQNDDTKYYLDVLGAQKKQGQPVDVTVGKNQNWRIVSPHP